MSRPLTQYLRLADHQLGLRTLRDAQSAGPKLLCLPHGGGQSLVFRELADSLPHEWRIWGVDLPGHGWIGGSPLVDVPSMAELCVRNIPTEILRGAILFGFSFGGFVVFEIAKRLAECGTPPPGLVLNATRPPHRLADYDSFVAMNDELLLSRLIEMGGMPEECATRPELFDLFKAAIRADAVAFETYTIASPLNEVPSLVLAGDDDMVYHAEHSFEWARYCPGCQVELVRGGHNFVQTQPRWVAEQLVKFAQRLPALEH